MKNSKPSSCRLTYGIPPSRRTDMTARSNRAFARLVLWEPKFYPKALFYRSTRGLPLFPSGNFYMRRQLSKTIAKAAQVLAACHTKLPLFERPQPRPQTSRPNNANGPGRTGQSGYSGSICGHFQTRVKSFLQSAVPLSARQRRHSRSPLRPLQVGANGESEAPSNIFDERRLCEVILSAGNTDCFDNAASK